jgi:heme-degrading monooxygenase HmoA
MTDASNPQPTYTVADWTVKPGAEDAFVQEWTRFSEWLLEHPGAESFTLLKGTQGARHYVSIAVWSGRGSAVDWAEFLRQWGKCRALCEHSHSRPYSPVAPTSHESRTRTVDLAA